MDRARLIELVQFGQATMRWEECELRDWLQLSTGKTSCEDCSDAELSGAVDLLLNMGALDRPAGFPPAHLYSSDEESPSSEHSRSFDIPDFLRKPKTGP